MKFGRKKTPVTPAGRRRPESTRGQTPAAFSYYSRRSESLTPQERRRSFQTPEVLSRKQLASTARFARQRFGLVIVAIAAVVALGNTVRLSPNSKVDSLNEPAASFLLHDQKTYETAANRYLAHSIWNGNKMTINTDAVTANLQRDFPELSSASLALPLVGHRPIIYIRAAAPRLLLTTTSGQSFVVDENGKALIAAARVPDLAALKLPVVNDESGIRLSEGKTVLSSAAVSFMRVVLAELSAQNVPVQRLVLPSATSELDVYPANVPYYVKFNLQSETALQQVGTYLATAGKLKEQGIAPSQYIDVRVDGRAYYK
ncbi:MAG: hypothetical protein ABIR37_02390 [Candidatus Saccharimonadales bacterium]